MTNSFLANKPAMAASHPGVVWIQGILLFVAVFVLQLYLISPAELLPVHDGLYHFIVAENISVQQPWFNIPWLPLTVLGEQGPDHQWFWHILIYPFTLFEDRVFGLKAAIAFYLASVPLAVYWFCHRQRIPLPLLWAILSITAALVLQRYALLRTQGLAVILILIALTALLEKRYLLLGIIAFVFMQSYHGAIVLLPLVGWYCLIQTWQERHLIYVPFVVVGMGILLGLVINPWYPKTVEYLLFHTIYKMGNTLEAGVGQEWEPLSWLQLFWQAWDIGALLLIFCGVYLIKKTRTPTLKINEDVIYLFGVSLFFLILYKFAWRFREYFVPFAVILCGLFYREWAPLVKKGSRITVVGLLMITCLVTTYRSYQEYRSTLYQTDDYFQLRGDYLAKHGKPGDVVFNSDWGDFPQMLWHAPQVTYVTGLDAHYLAYGNRELFDWWMRIGFTKLAERHYAVNYLEEHFSARWVSISTFAFKYGHALELYNDLVRDPRARLRATDRKGWLFEIMSLEPAESQ